MNREDVHQLFRMLGSKVILNHGNWVTGECPFAPWKHKTGKDEHPSFGISVDESSSYHCFSCDLSGKIKVLPTVLAKFSGKDPIELRKFLAGSESAFNLAPRESYVPKCVPLEESILNKYPKLKTNYKSINMDSVRRWDLRYDKEESRIIFPIRNSKGQLIAIRGRFTGEGGIRYRTYSELQEGDDAKKCGVWMGEHFPVTKEKLLFLVEGERDAVLLRQAGFSQVWASMGASITKAQLDKIASCPYDIVCFFDDDKAGHQATGTILKACKGLKVPKIVFQYAGCKDPAEIVEKGKLDIIKQHLVQSYQLGKALATGETSSGNSSKHKLNPKENNNAKGKSKDSSKGSRPRRSKNPSL